MTETNLTPAKSDKLAHVRSLSLDTGDLRNDQISSLMTLKRHEYIIC